MRLNLLDDIPIKPELVALFDSVSHMKPDAPRTTTVRFPKAFPTLSKLEASSSNNDLEEIYFSFYLKAPVIRRANAYDGDEFKKLFAFAYLENIFTLDHSEKLLFSLISSLKKARSHEDKEQASSNGQIFSSNERLLQFIKLLYIYKRNNFKNGTNAFQKQFSAMLEALVNFSEEFEKSLIELTRTLLEEHNRKFKEISQGDEIPFLYELSALAQQEEIEVDFYSVAENKVLSSHLINYSNPNHIFPIRLAFLIFEDEVWYGYSVEFAKISYQKSYLENEKYDFAHLKGFQELLKKNASLERTEVTHLKNSSKNVIENLEIQEDYILKLLDLVEALNTNLWELNSSRVEMAEKGKAPETSTKEKEKNDKCVEGSAPTSVAKFQRKDSIEHMTLNLVVEENKRLKEELECERKKMDHQQELEEYQKELGELRKIIINLERENMRLRENLEESALVEKDKYVAISRNNNHPSKQSAKVEDQTNQSTGMNKLLLSLLSNGSNKADIEHFTRELEIENGKLKKLLNDRGKAMLEKEKFLRETVNENYRLSHERKHFQKT